MPTSLTHARPAIAIADSGLARFAVIFLALAAFGPYVIGSVRTEQIAAYGLLVLAAPLVASSLFKNASAVFIVPWTCYLLLATLGVAFPSQVDARWDRGSVLAGYDNMLLPLAIMAVVWSVVPRHQAPRLLGTVSRIVAVAMAANGLLAAISIRVDLSPYLRPFWSTAAAEGLTVAELASQLGRFGGVFNQPAEAGALYGIGGLAAIYIWKDRPLRLALIVGLITIGGMISVSKVFVLGGLPLIFLYWMWTQKRGRKVSLLIGLGLLLLGVLQSGLFAEWSGTYFLTRLFNPEGGLVSFYTAGRLESGSSVSQIVGEVLAISPISGMGAAGWVVAYDGALAESMIMAGVLGLLMYAIVLLAIFLIGKRIADPHLRRFSLLFAVIVAGSAAGFSPLTGNRVASIVWLIIALLVLCQEQRSTGPRRQAEGDDSAAQTSPSISV